MDTTREKAKKIFDLKAIKKNKKMWGIIAIIVIALLAILYIRLFVYQAEAKVTSEQLNLMLSEESELTSAKLNGKGYSIYEDEGLPIISKSDFLMTYEYTVRAGIDVKKIETKVYDNKSEVVITIPKAEIQDIKVEPESIDLYDEDFALFNTNEREDMLKAQTEAEKHALEDAKETGILEYANQQAEKLIKGIVADAIPEDYKLIIKVSEE